MSQLMEIIRSVKKLLEITPFEKTKYLTLYFITLYMGNNTL